jgi:hypothetical protein
MSAGVSLGTVASVVGIAAGVNSLMGGSGGNVSSGVQNAADPFASYRQNLAAMYSGALQPGGTTDITQMPGYSQFTSGVLNPAMEATKRSMTASGMSMSGNEEIALNKQANQGYYGFMTDYLNRLAQGSGAVNNPAQATQLGMNAANQGWGAIAQGVGGLNQLFTNNTGNAATISANNYTMSNTPNYLDAAGQLPSLDYSGFNATSY